MNQRSIRNLFLILALLLVTCLVSYRAGQNNSKITAGTTDKLDLNLMWQVKSKLEKTFLEKDKMSSPL